MKEKKTAKRRGSIDHSETFDEFLVSEGLLANTEDAAIKQIIVDQIKVAMQKQASEQIRNGRPNADKPPSA